MKRLAIALGTLAIVLFVEFVAAGTSEQIMADGTCVWRVKDDADLKKLALPKRLREAWLNDSQVTDAGLIVLVHLGELNRLNLYNSKVTDAGLKGLAAFKKLEDLYLGFTHVTDAGLKDLVLLKQLKTLDLTSTQVTDAGLKDLASMTQLQTLFLNATSVTDAGLTGLKRALPKCRIFPFILAKNGPDESR